MSNVMIINGPNLNLLGKRQPEFYGAQTLGDVEAHCENTAKELGQNIRFLQSNYEGQIVEWIHEAREEMDAIVINAGAFTHYSYAIADALRAFDGAIVEVHISNVHQREEFRHHSVISEIADGVIVGCGGEGYALALRYLASRG